MQQSCDNDAPLHYECNKCSRLGHPAEECDYIIDINGNKLQEYEILCTYCTRPFYNNKDYDLHKDKCLSTVESLYIRSSKKCSRCARIGHFEDTCNEKFHIKGYRLVRKLV